MTVLPSFIEGYPVDLRQNVRSCWWLSDLKCGAAHEILWTDTAQRLAEFGKHAKNRLSVLGVGADKEIEIFRGAGFGVHAERISADDQILNSVSVECA